MREYQVQFNGFSNGLRPTDRVDLNAENLTQATGAFPDVDGLHVVDNVTAPAAIIALGETFPFPQVFRLSNIVVIAGQTKIWEMVGSTITLKLSSLTAGSIWTVADFGYYILMTNGKIVIKRSGDSLVWSVVSDVYNPVGRSVCAHKGQLILTAPGSTV